MTLSTVIRRAAGLAVGMVVLATSPSGMQAPGSTPGKRTEPLYTQAQARRGEGLVKQVLRRLPSRGPRER